MLKRQTNKYFTVNSELQNVYSERDRLKCHSKLVCRRKNIGFKANTDGWFVVAAGLIEEGRLKTAMQFEVVGVSVSV